MKGNGQSQAETVPVLHLVNGEFYAGAERVQDLLALRLPEFGYSIGFVCLKEGIFPENRLASEVPLKTFAMRSSVDLRWVPRLAKLIREDGYRLIHTHTVRGALLGQLASAMSGVPMVHHVHSPTDEDTENRFRNLRNSLVEKASLGRARKLLPVSSSLCDYLLDRGYRKDDLRLVCNGVPVQDVCRGERSPDEPFTVGTVALFRPRKGLEVLLDAISLLANDGLEVGLHAVGPFETDDYRQHILDRVRKLGLQSRVHWTGFTEDVTAEFRNMHAFVLPSLFGEGMPMVVLEAMAAGVPVISTRVEGIPQAIRDGREGLIVEPNNADALAASIRRIAIGEIDPASLGDAGRQRQQQQFSDVAMARAVSEVYDELQLQG